MRKSSCNLLTTKAQSSVLFDLSALNPNFRAHSQRGIGRYVEKLWSEFQRLLPNNSFIEGIDLSSKIQSKPLYKFVEKKVPVGKTTINRQITSAFLIKKLASKKIVHFPAHIDAPAFPLFPFIVTVLDLIPVVLKELYSVRKPSWRFALGRKLELQAIKSARHIIAISKTTARDVKEVLKIPEEKI
ncbi:MAG: hypothetical protein D6780_03415, partial [Candidatus Dadabacteria bacterium]